MPSPPLGLSTGAAILTRHSTELTDPEGGPITGGQVVPSHWRNSHQSGPIPLAGDKACTEPDHARACIDPDLKSMTALMRIDIGQADVTWASTTDRRGNEFFVVRCS